MSIREIKNELPNSLIEQNKTDKTDKTDFSGISSVDFINEIFGELTLERPITPSFKGNPATVTKN